jgi:hypothetical protein
VVTRGERGDALADLFDDAGALVAEHDRRGERDGAVLHGEVGVADPRRHDLDLDLARSRRGDLDVVVDVDVFPDALQHCCGDHWLPLGG